MGRNRKMSRATGLILSAVVLMVAVAVFVSTLPKAEAIAGPSMCTYYKDAKYRTAVGARGTGCCGEIISWGVTSAYKKCETLYCLDVLCPN